MAKSNQPLLDELTAKQRADIIEGADALKELNAFKRIAFTKWMKVAHGIAPLCDLAERPGMSRKARKHLLIDNGYDLSPGTVSRLRLMAKLEREIEAWRKTLTQNQRDNWNGPTSICNRCPAVKRAIAEANKDKPVRQRRVVKDAAASSDVEALKARIAELEYLAAPRGETSVCDALVRIHDDEFMGKLDVKNRPEKWTPKQKAFVLNWAVDWTFDEMTFVQDQIETLAQALESLEAFKEDNPKAYAKLMKEEDQRSEREFAELMKVS